MISRKLVGDCKIQQRLLPPGFTHLFVTCLATPLKSPLKCIALVSCFDSKMSKSDIWWVESLGWKKSFSFSCFLAALRWPGRQNHTSLLECQRLCREKGQPMTTPTFHIAKWSSYIKYPQWNHQMPVAAWMTPTNVAGESPRWFQPLSVICFVAKAN